MKLVYLGAVIAGALYAINQLWALGKLTFGKNKPEGFFGKDSWTRKYNGTVAAPNTFYYKFFKLKYKERFPGSATFLVSLTDGFHFSQHFFFVVLIMSLAFMSNQWYDFAIYHGTLLFSFAMFYKLFQR